MWADYIEYIFEYIPLAAALREQITSCGPYGRAVELGCSIGGAVKHIAGISKEAVGIDLSEDRIRMAKERFRHIRFELKDARHTGYKDKSFDGVFLVMMLHELPDPALVKEACRLAPEVVVIDYNYPVSGPWGSFFRFMEGEKLEQLEEFQVEKRFEDNGFKLVEKKIFYTNFRKWIFRGDN